jgi:hypothetical protein
LPQSHAFLPFVTSIWPHSGRLQAAFCTAVKDVKATRVAGTTQIVTPVAVQKIFRTKSMT